MLKKIPHNSSERSCSQNYKLQNHRCKLLSFFFCDRFLYVSPRSNNYEVSVKIVMPFRCWHAKQLYLIPLKMTICLLYLSCSTRPTPHPPGIDYRLGFFPGDLGKIGELFVNNSFSVEQVISYFAVTGVSKQILLFALIIFHLYGRLNAFFIAYAIGFFHTVVIGSCINFRLSSS